MEEFTVVSTAEERLAAFLRDIGFDAGLVEKRGAISVKLSGLGRFALVTGSGTEANVWHVVATDYRQICVGAYSLWVALVGLGAHYGYVDEGQIQILVWNNRWLKADKAVSAFVAEGIKPQPSSKATQRIYDWLLAEEGAL